MIIEIKQAINSSVKLWLSNDNQVTLSSDSNELINEYVDKLKPLKNKIIKYLKENNIYSEADWIENLKKKYCPLSKNQKNLFYLSELSKKSCYNMQYIIRLLPIASESHFDLAIYRTFFVPI